MSIVNLARREGRLLILIGLTRHDVDMLIGSQVVYLEAKPGNVLPDLAIFASETAEDLEKQLAEMEKPEDE